MRTKLLSFALCSSLLFSYQSAYAAMQDEFTQSIVDTENGAIKDSTVIFPYYSEKQYLINTQVGYITDLKFHPGEKIVYVGAGDTKRWLIDSSTVANTPHLYIKPILEGETYSTNLVVNTNERVYRLIIKSSSSYIPSVEWSYADDFSQAMAKVAKEEKKEEIIKEKYFMKKNFSYKVTDTKYKDWIPEKIYDDGTQTYISIPKQTKNDLPTIHILEGKKSYLVNYRILNNEFVIDRIFKKAILYFDNNKSITIINTKGDKS